MRFRIKNNGWLQLTQTPLLSEQRHTISINSIVLKHSQVISKMIYLVLKVRYVVSKLNPVTLCSVENKYWKCKKVLKVRYVVSKLNVIVYVVLKINAWSQNSLVTTMYLVWKHWHVFSISQIFASLDS